MNDSYERRVQDSFAYNSLHTLTKSDKMKLMNEEIETLQCITDSKYKLMQIINNLDEYLEEFAIDQNSHEWKALDLLEISFYNKET